MQKQSGTGIWNSLLACSLVLSLTGLAGCGEKMVYNRSIAELNQKAQALLAQGDAAGAVSRLESARDLNPEEPSTLFNLGIAYQQKGDFAKAAETLEQLLTLSGGPPADTVHQSLGVIYEEQADALLATSEEAENKPSAAKPAQDAQPAVSKTAAVSLFQKAIAHYQKIQTIGEPKLAAEKQVSLLEKKITELSQG